MGKVLPFARIEKMVRDTRPVPPATLGDIDDFAPDQDGLGAWVQRMFIEPGGALHNPRHEHLADAKIAWLWTTAENTARDKAVAGECRQPGPPSKKWQSAQSRWLLRHWFGDDEWDFIITISAPYAEFADDWSFCALIEHELCHAAQDIDMNGEPRFDREGRPMFRLVGHDVEQFHDVVERYGAAASGVDRMVQLANAGPIFGQAQIDAACGNCVRRKA
jgi:hypothetical protein